MKATEPKNDDELNDIHERIIKGAIYLEHPFITEEDKKKGMVLYDELVKVARTYIERDRNKLHGLHRK